MNGASKSKKTVNKPMRHIILPHDALVTIDLLHTLEPDTNMAHVAFLFGISVKTLEKLRRALYLATEGDEQACAAYESRLPFMRNVYAYLRLLEHDRDTVVALLHDAKQNASSSHNVLAKKERVQQLCGLDHSEQFNSYIAHRHYLES
ncbi:hypothetical protein AB9X29_003711 [Vibrio vulnificus]